MDALRAKVLRVRGLGAGFCSRTSGEKGVEDLPYVREERDKPQGREQRSLRIASGGVGWAGSAFIFSIGLHNVPHPRYAGHTPVTGRARPTWQILRLAHVWRNEGGGGPGAHAAASAPLSQVSGTRTDGRSTPACPRGRTPCADPSSAHHEPSGPRSCPPPGVQEE
jgi:hypothetical protein